MYILVMARRAIPIIAFHGVELYIYIYMFVSLARLCVVYVVKEVASFPGAFMSLHSIKMWNTCIHCLSN